MTDREWQYAQSIGKQMGEKYSIFCPRCREQEELEQPLRVVGDVEIDLFCPHCELGVSIAVYED